MDQEKQRQRKQLYLRQQVIQQGYDPGQFVDYLSELKMPQDIDLLSLNQVKQAVQSFKTKKLSQGNKKSSSKLSRSSVSIPQKQQTKQQIQTEKKVKQIFYEKYGVYENQFERSYKCMKFASYPKNKSVSPQIFVSDPQRKTAVGFFFASLTSYLTFKIDTPEYGWSVRRRYTDFQWLYNIMQKLFPSYVLPPLPKKNKNKKSSRDIDKRMMLLTYLLNDISNIPTVMHNRYILGFLNLNSQPQFEELKKQGNSQKGFQIITEIQTETGNLTIGLTNKQKVYMEEIDKLSLSSQTIYKQLTAKSKSLQACFIEETNTLYKMGNLFADLYTNLKQFNTKVPEQYQQNPLSDIYVICNNMLVQWGNIIRQQHGFIQKNFNSFIRYSRNQIYSLRDQLAKIQNIQQQFFKSTLQLQKKKDKIFNLNDFSKWDVPQQKYPILMQNGILKNRQKSFKIMLPKQTYELEKLRIEYGFYSSQFCLHSKEMIKRQSQKFGENFKQFAITIKVNAQQLSEMWNEVSGDFSNKKKKQIVIQNSDFQDKYKEEMYDDG